MVVPAESPADGRTERRLTTPRAAGPAVDATAADPDPPLRHLQARGATVRRLGRGVRSVAEPVLPVRLRRVPAGRNHHRRRARDEPGDSNAVSTSSSSVYVLRADTLTKIGELDGLGKRQRIYAVRFIGPLGYVVTFQQMDPLYTLDLRDPAAPRIAGTLELTGYSAYLHPASGRTLIGIGQEATAQGRPLGLQISLFDVSNPGRPRRLAHLVKTNFQSGAESDPHAFLYWPQTGTAVLPVNSWTNGQFNAGALVLSVAHNQITEHGTVTQPTQPVNTGQAGIARSLVIGHDLWTVSDGGLMVNDLATLDQQAWIPNQ